MFGTFWIQNVWCSWNNYAIVDIETLGMLGIPVIKDN